MLVLATMGELDLDTVGRESWDPWIEEYSVPRCFLNRLNSNLETSELLVPYMAFEQF